MLWNLIVDKTGWCLWLRACNRNRLIRLCTTIVQRKAILIASQLPVSKWYEYIADPTLVDAILDRLTSHSRRIELKGKSLRNDK